jgi:C-terminal processing protease CtpA/Prc
LSLLALPLFLVAAGVALGQPFDWYFEPPFVPHRTRIGVQVQPMTSELREHFGAPPDQGILVTRVVDGSPAARGGVEVGDVIVSAAGTPMRQPFDLMKVVGHAAQGQAIELRLVRDGEKHELTVEPEGEAMPWLDPKHWSERLSKSMRQGAEEIRHRLEEIERRLEELDRRLEEERMLREQGARET